MSNKTNSGPITAGCLFFPNACGKVPGNVTLMIPKVTCPRRQTLGCNPVFNNSVLLANSLRHILIPTPSLALPMSPLIKAGWEMSARSQGRSR